MNLTQQNSMKKILCILLSVCMIIGLMPVISLPARAEDDPNTIDWLEDGTARYGNGWAWDGRGTLTLFGAKIDAGSDDVFNYDGSNINVELVGYNEVSSTARFAETNGTVTIQRRGLHRTASSAA